MDHPSAGGVSYLLHSITSPDLQYQSPFHDMWPCVGIPLFSYILQPADQLLFRIKPDFEHAWAVIHACKDPISSSIGLHWIVSKILSLGKHASCPYIRKNGDTPIDELVCTQWAKKVSGKNLSHWFCHWGGVILASICVRLLLNFSSLLFIEQCVVMLYSKSAQAILELVGHKVFTVVWQDG